jgi:hypothetical protein
MTVVSILPNLSVSWARFCTTVDVTIYEVAAGLTLLKGPAGVEWLARGYTETLKAVRNTGARVIMNPVDTTALDRLRARYNFQINGSI